MSPRRVGLPTNLSYYLRSYIVDGNALFLTATEAAWRRATGPNYHGGGILVAVGYPALPEGRVYSPRRGYDLTPPGTSPEEDKGGAEHMLDFVQNVVKPFILTTVFPGLVPARQALYGHSFGGLFSLFALYTRPTAFDLYVASSPSVFWEDFRIVTYEKRFCDGDSEGSESSGRGTNTKPTLVISYGSYEQGSPQWPDETDEHYKKRTELTDFWAMVENARRLHKRLEGCKRLSGVVLKGYPEEDHGTVMACSLSRTLTTFFEEWPIFEA